jgi:hypothetical protein
MNINRAQNHTVCKDNNFSFSSLGIHLFVANKVQQHDSGWRPRRKKFLLLFISNYLCHVLKNVEGGGKSWKFQISNLISIIVEKFFPLFLINLICLKLSSSFLLSTSPPHFVIPSVMHFTLNITTENFHSYLAMWYEIEDESCVIISH